MKLWKYSGTLLTATGVIHTIYALFLGKEAFTEGTDIHIYTGNPSVLGGISF